jgi:hypothetical protein
MGRQGYTCKIIEGAALAPKVTLNKLFKPSFKELFFPTF